MKTGFTAIALFVLQLGTYAQQASYDIITGPELPMKKDAVLDYFPVSDGSTVKVGNENKVLEYQKLGADLVVTATAPVLTEEDKKAKRWYAYTEMLDGHLYKFTYTKDKDAVGFHLFYQEIDQSSLKPFTAAAEFYFAKAESGKYVTMGIEPERWIFPSCVNADRSRIAIVAQYNNEADKKTFVEVAVFDSKMKELWKINQTLSLSRLGGKSFVSLDNVITIWAPINVDKNGAVTAGGEAQYWNFAANGTASMFEIALDKGRIISNFGIHYNPKTSALNVAGIYRNSGSSKDDGFFMMSIDAVTLKTDEAILVPADIPVAETEDNRNINSLSKVKIDNDGRFTFIVENLYVTQSFGGDYPSTFFHMHDIHVYRIAGEGSLTWECHVPKKQYVANDDFGNGSALILFSGDKIFLIYNDKKGNEKIASSDEMKESNVKENSQKTLAIIDANGKLAREVFAPTLVDKHLNMGKSLILKEGVALMYCEDKKTYQLSKVTFK